jgi:acetyl esterase/lipase
VSEDILERELPDMGQRIAYGAEPQQFGELRMPSGEGPYHVVIGIHGGYWRARYDLNHFGHVCSALTAAGFATWNIEYRRTGETGGGWPGTFQDVATATDLLRILAPQHNLALDQVLSVGHSAGGHLAFWLASRHKIDSASQLYTPDPLPLAGAVALAGVVDLRHAWALGLSHNATGLLMGGSPADYSERYAAGSPYDLLPLGIRQFLLHGTTDEDVPLEMSERYVRQAVAKGDAATLLTLPDIGHFELIDPTSSAWPTVLSIITALRDE